MSTVLENKPVAQDDMSESWRSRRSCRRSPTRSTRPATSTRSCWSWRGHLQLFNADRLTIYSIGEDKGSIVSKVKTGLNSFKDLKLPIAEQSIAGYVALSQEA